MNNPTHNVYIEPYNKEVLSWKRWVKRLETAMEMMDLQPEKKKPVLLHYMGMECYNTLCDLALPKEPEGLTYQEVVDKLTSHYEPRPLEMVELFKFWQRKQQEGETVAEYAKVLQKEARFCGFAEYLNKALRNQFVFGLQNKAMQTRLLEEKELTWEKATTLASAMEATQQGIGIVRHEAAAAEVKFVEKSQKPELKQKNYKPASLKCYRCGSDGHMANMCRHATTTCLKCKKVGHLQRVCRNNTKKKVNVVEEIHDSEEEEEEIV
ncbi:uncharacterized protein LOC118516987 [Anopheles stephensi]|uniref:uncharacterized protein LOC118516987 n=2 Tax=Anopheles stephensi TaxID=30069 RepID=UPI001658B9F7|nr:uncharacterized protein LOC118516987 [Anopheles stephensi]